MFNSYTQEDIHRILVDFRILRATVDTVRINFRLEDPAQRKTMERLTGAKGYGLEICPETGTRIRGGHCWRLWTLSFQDPSPDGLLNAMHRVNERWGIQTHWVQRLDVAFDAKRKGVRKDLPILEPLVMGSARHDLLSVYLTCLVPLKQQHQWRAFEGKDGTVTHYLGHRHSDLFRVYDKLVDQRQPLAPADRVVRLELSFRRQTLSRALGINTLEALVLYDQWRSVLGFVHFVDRDGYVLRALQDRMGKSLDRMGQHWTANRQRWERGVLEEPSRCLAKG